MADGPIMDALRQSTPEEKIEHLEKLLDEACSKLQALLPTFTWDVSKELQEWWKSYKVEKDRKQECSRIAAQEQTKVLAAQARTKLTPEELEALRFSIEQNSHRR